MSDFVIPTRAEVEATQIARRITHVMTEVRSMRAAALAIDNASAGSYKTRCGLADAADSLEHALEGLAEGFKVEI